jgi:hypothetical protein
MKVPPRAGEVKHEMEWKCRLFSRSLLFPYTPLTGMAQFNKRATHRRSAQQGNEIADQQADNGSENPHSFHLGDHGFRDSVHRRHVHAHR